MNNIAISPNILMYALQNQNVERKIAKHIDIKNLQQRNEINIDSTSIDQLTNTREISEDYNNDIPSILIPKEEPEPLPQTDIHIGETFINNDNIELVRDEIKENLKSLNDNKFVSSSL
jgi:hypothetical protein